VSTCVQTSDTEAVLDEQKFQAARLLLVTERPYYASVIYRCPVVVTTAVPIMAVDRGWRLYINPKAVDLMKISRVAAALAHEANHLLRDHAERGTGIGVRTRHEHETWNFAADAELNDDLKRDGLDVSPNWVFPSTIGQPDDLTAEQYYNAMPRNWTVGDPFCGPGAGGTEFTGELASQVPADDDPLFPAVHEFEARMIRQQAASDVRDFAHRGSVPGGLVDWAKQVLEPKVDWRRQLAAAIRSAATTPGTFDYDHRRPSRRQSVAGGVVWPGMVHPLARVAVVVDTSASMSDGAITRCLTEVQGMLRSASIADESVRILTVDTRVAEDRRITDVRSVRRMGRGGTDMRIGIEQALASRPRPTTLVVLTDGYTPWPEAPAPGVTMIVGLVWGSGTRAPRPDVPAWARTIEIDVDG